MASTTFPVAKLNLVTLLQGLAGLAGVTVGYGDPGVSKLEAEHVFLGSMKPESWSWAPYGQLKRDEQYVITFWVHVAKQGRSQQEATERAAALLTAIEGGVRPKARTSTQIAPGVYEISLAPVSFDEFAIDGGYAAFVEGEIEIKARF